MQATTISHTPGPWQVVQNGSQIDVHSAKVSDGGMAREFTVATDVRPQDARLVAAAPEMLRALREIERVRFVEVDAASVQNAYDMVADAIAKATE